MTLALPSKANNLFPFCCSPQARNDFELRRLMELDPAFAGSAGPEEARRRTARRKLRLQMKDPSEEMSGGLARKATKRRHLAKPR